MRTGLGRSTWVLLGFLAVAGFLLTTEHRAHFLGGLPYLLLLACPFLHLFSHGHHESSIHEGHSHRGHQPEPPSGGTP